MTEAFGGRGRDVVRSWMDPDFLETLFPVTLNFVDSRTEYSFWSLWSAPLLVATDLRNLSAEKASIVANPEVIAIDQDPLGRAGNRLFNTSMGGQVWSKQLSNGDVAGEQAQAVSLLPMRGADTDTGWRV